MLHVFSSFSNKNHTKPLSLISLSQLNLQTMGLRPLSNRDAIQPWMGHWSSSTPTLESERRSRVMGRDIDPESCDYEPTCDPVLNSPGLHSTSWFLISLTWAVDVRSLSKLWRPTQCIDVHDLTKLMVLHTDQHEQIHKLLSFQQSIYGHTKRTPGPFHVLSWRW